MLHITAYSYQGGKDLYMGTPNLDGATFICATQEPDNDHYSTRLTFKLANGLDFSLVIKQEK